MQSENPFAPDFHMEMEPATHTACGGEVKGFTCTKCGETRLSFYYKNERYVADTATAEEQAYFEWLDKVGELDRQGKLDELEKLSDESNV